VAQASELVSLVELLDAVSWQLAERQVSAAEPVLELRASAPRLRAQMAQPPEFPV